MVSNVNDMNDMRCGMSMMWFKVMWDVNDVMKCHVRCDKCGVM